jgi:subtilisin family serine protease
MPALLARGGALQAPDDGGWGDTEIHVDATIRRMAPASMSVPNEWIISVKPGASPELVARRMGCRVKRALRVPGAFLVQRDPSVSDAAVASVAAASPEVAYVEPNRVCRVCDVPDDPDYRLQWQLRTVKMPDAWSIQKGTIDVHNPGIVVAVVDTGISRTHPDLQGRIAPGGTNLYSPGADFQDDNGHGTHVAGILAATTNNGVGVAGVAWEGVKLLPVKAFNSNGESSVELLADGIMYAADSGAHVINVSAGISFFSRLLQDAVRYALSRPQKPILVAASGNESDRSRGDIVPVIYPANFTDDRVIAVAAVGPTGSVAYYSNANSRPKDSNNGGVDIAAPGGNDPENGLNPENMILSTSWDPIGRRNFYEYLQGTSMSAPMVSGTVALLLSEGARPEDVENILYTTTDKRGATARNETYGWGVLDVNAALRAIAVLPQIKWPKPASVFNVETKTTLISATVLNAPSGSVQVLIDGQPASPPVTIQSVDARTLRIANARSIPTGLHTLSISATSAATGRTRTAQVEFQVAPRVFQPGLYMFSLPYKMTAEGADPAAVFSSKPYRMARWLPATGEYAYHDPPTSRLDARASFNPTSTTVTEGPAGIGYWLRLTEPTLLFLPGDPVLASEYRIPLAKGWTMVGNPFVFPVALSSLQYQVGSTKLPLEQAIARGWLGGTFHTFATGTPSGYIPLRSDTGMLATYQAVWVRALTAGTLIVPGG